MKLTITRPNPWFTAPLALLCLTLASLVQASPNPSEGMLPGGRMGSNAAGEQLLSAGFMHTCAIKPDGTLACWGNNGYGQINTPTGTFTALSSGEYHTCALKTDGTLACWGNNDFDQLTYIPTGTFTALSAGTYHTCALKTDGTLSCWGYNSFGQSTAPTGTFTALSAGGLHTCALKTDGTLSCWGHTGNDRLIAPTGTFTTLSAGDSHTCALRTNGTLACWGDNGAGQLNNIPTGTFTALSAGHLHTCALKTDGTLACWGHDSYNQQLNNTPTGTFTALGAGYYHTCALKTDGSLTCWGDDTVGQSTAQTGNFARRTVAGGYRQTCEIRTSGSLACWGNNSWGQLTNIPTGTFTALSAGSSHICALKTNGTLTCWGSSNGIPPSYTFTALSAGISHTCALKTDGTLACWGDNNFGQATAPSGTFTALSAGDFHTCALKTDGTLACWGTNNFSVLTNIPTGTFTAVSAGNLHTCALKTDSTLACWGNNASNKLNIPTGTFTALSAGSYHTCALRTDGTLACWGDNTFGQLTNIPTGTFTALSTNGNHTCALRTEGTLVCWGNNSDGQAPQLSLSPTILPDGMLGAAYSQALTVTATNYTPLSPVFSMTGTLPTGLNFVTDTLSGTPTAAGSFPLTAQAVDANGFAANQAYTLPVNESTAPAITPVVSGTQGSNGWYTSDVTVTWSVVDNESSITSQLNCSPTTISTDTSAMTLTCQATSSGGTASQSVTIKRDATAPSASLSISAGSLGSNGWYTSNVTVTTTGTDALSGIASCSANQTVTSDTASTDLAGSCTDLAGNSGNATPLTIKRDTTAPFTSMSVTAGILGSNGWYTSDVTVATIGADTLSGIATCSTAQTVNSDTAGTILAGVCSDQAGNFSNAAPLTIKRDTVVPTLAPVVTPSPVSLNGSASAIANAADALSGIATASCGTLDTSTVGERSVLCSATDLAGNSASAEAKYTVRYQPGGFSASVANSPQLNRVKAGDQVPFNWRVTDANGQPVANLGGVTLTVEPMACPAGAGQRVKMAKGKPGGLGFQNLGNGNYRFNWKTLKSYGNTCQSVKLGFNGGTGQELQALFRFTRK